MKTQFVKKTLIMAAAFLLVFTACGAGMAESYSGQTIRLLRYEGDVEIADANGQPRFVLENARFASGESMRTGEESLASVSLDTDRIVTLDQLSRVEFLQEGNHVRLNLTEGTLLLDVQDKLDENETLDIETSTMTVGIRGTIVFLRAANTEESRNTAALETRLEKLLQNPDTPGSAATAAKVETLLAGLRDGTTTLGVLEGTAHISYTDGSDTVHAMDVPAGNVAVVTDRDGDSRPEEVVTRPAEIGDISAFVLNQITEDAQRLERVMESTDLFDFSADGKWEWTGTVTLAAQSASKLYDGTPLTRPSDVLVYGLPEVFGIRASANGSITDAGESENPIAAWVILNSKGEDVSAHFPSVETVSGVLKVDPAPLTVWTGSAEKPYDGTPLTNKETKLTAVPGYETNQPEWRNTSQVLSEANGAEVMYGVSGVVWAHATNPLTGETREIELRPGERMKVFLKDGSDGESLVLEVEDFSEEEIPADILRMYADNPELLEQACADAGWNVDTILERIAQLRPEEEKSTVTRHGLKLSAGQAAGLMLDSTNVRITVDTGITDYSSRPLNNNEAHFTPIDVNAAVEIIATGSQTEIGESPNTYEIKWGSVNPENYILTEDLGTLTVTAPRGGVTFTAASAEKPYDGTVLTDSGVTATGLPQGFSFRASAAGSITDAGSAENRVSFLQILNGEEEDVTELFTDKSLVSGTLTIHPVPLTVTTGSAEKVYDGTALTNGEAAAAGLVNGEQVTVSASGSITAAGEAENTAVIVWGNTKAENYEVTEIPGKLTVKPLEMELDLGGSTEMYGGAELPTPQIIFLNGPHAGETANGYRTRGGEIRGSAAQAVFRFDLFTGDTVEVTVAAEETAAGERTLTAQVRVPEGLSGSFRVASVTDTVMAALPGELRITTSSASKAYDGTALTSAEVTVVGLRDGDEITVTATGTVTDVGTAENSYTIDWGTVDSASYTVTEELGTLEVTANETAIAFTAASGEKTYDGKALTNAEVTAEGLPEGFSFTAEAEGSVTDAGSAENMVVSYAILDADGRDVTAYFTNISTICGTLTVNPAALTITTSSASKAYDGSALTSAEATVEGLAEGEESTVTADGTLTDVGTAENSYTIDWGAVNKENYTVTENIGTLEVTANETAIAFTAASAEKTYDGKALTNAEVTAEGLPEGFSFTAEAEGSVTDAGSAENTVVSYAILDADGKDVTAYFPNISTIGGTLTVNKAAVTITTSSASKAYDGTALTSAEATAEGLAEGEEITVTATGTLTDVGTAENTVTIDWGTVKEDNYTVTENTGTLEVTANETAIAFTAASGEKTYDGKALTNTEVTAEGLPAGFNFTAEAEGSVTDAGSAENTVVSYTILDADGKDVTAYFPNISTIGGTLTVNKAAVTITTSSASKAYDGTALTSAEATAEGLAEGEEITVTADGTLTDVGTAENSYTIDWGTVNKENYTVTEALGTLTVTANGTAIIFTAASAEKVYDGKALTNAEVTAEGLPAGFSFTAEAGGSVTDAGSAENSVVSYAILDANEKDVTAYFTNISTASGTLTVNKAVLTVTTSSAGKPYDGAALTAPASVTGLAEGEEITVTATGAITDVGTAENTVTIDWGTVNKENYTVTEALGTLTVTANGTAIAFTAASGEKTYDGKALTNTEVTAEGLPAGFSFTAEAEGSVTDAGSAENKVASYAILKDGRDVTAYFPNISTIGGTLTVNPAELTITTSSASKPYDGTALTAPASVTGLAEGEEITVTADGTLTDVGTAENSYTIGWGTVNKENYTVTENIGTLEVTANGTAVTFTAASGEKAYDGKALTDGTVTAEGLPEALSFTAAASGSVTNAGSAENTVVSYTILDADGRDVTAYFPNISTIVGTLTVNKAVLTITTGSASKPYNGTVLTAPASVAGLAEGEEITVTATGTITNVGTAENTYTLDWGTVNSANYTVSKSIGTLEVTTNATPITITAKSASKEYDGTPLTGEEECEVEGLPTEGDALWAYGVAEGSRTDAGSSPNAITEYKIGDREEKDVTAYFTNITLVPGTLTVNPATITVTTSSGSKTYDGYPVGPENTDAPVTGLPSMFEGSITATPNGSLTDVGTAPSTYEMNWNGANPDNFTINENLGTLEVTPLDVEFSLGGGYDVYYDGEFHGGDLNEYDDLDGYFNVEQLSVTQWKLTGINDTVVEVTITGGGTEPDEYPLTCTYSFIPESKKKNFNISMWGETLRIVTVDTAIVLSSETLSKPYDGTPLAADTVTVTGSLPYGFELNTGISGSQTEVGYCTPTIEYTILNENGKDVTNIGTFTNVDVSPGTLTVTANDTPVVFIAETKTREFNNEALTGSLKVTGLPDGLTGTGTVTGSRTEVGSCESTVSSRQILDSGGNDVTGYFTDITTQDGTLTVTNPVVTFNLHCNDTQTVSRYVLPKTISASYTDGTEAEGFDQTVTPATSDTPSSISKRFTLRNGATYTVTVYGVSDSDGGIHTAEYDYSFLTIPVYEGQVLTGWDAVSYTVRFTNDQIVVIVGGLNT